MELLTLAFPQRTILLVEVTLFKGFVTVECQSQRIIASER